MTPDGEIVYLQARYLDPPATRSKYDNPSARLAANPRLAWTRSVGPPSDAVLVVCEGTADSLIAAQAGLASVGVLGAGYPDARVADGLVTGLRHHPSVRGAEVAICLDSDPAGTAGSARLVELLAERNVAARECRPPDSLDLTTWASVEPRWTDTLPTRHATLAAPTVNPAAPLPPPAAERSISIGGIG
jgi:Toprim-like